MPSFRHSVKLCERVRAVLSCRKNPAATPRVWCRTQRRRGRPRGLAGPVLWCTSLSRSSTFTSLPPGRDVRPPWRRHSSLDTHRLVRPSRRHPPNRRSDLFSSSAAGGVHHEECTPSPSSAMIIEQMRKLARQERPDAHARCRAGARRPRSRGCGWAGSSRDGCHPPGSAILGRSVASSSNTRGGSRVR
jgi:hypothetical protein